MAPPTDSFNKRDVQVSGTKSTGLPLSLAPAFAMSSPSAKFTQSLFGFARPCCENKISRGISHETGIPERDFSTSSK